MCRCNKCIECLHEALRWDDVNRYFNIAKQPNFINIIYHNVIYGYADYSDGHARIGNALSYATKYCSNNIIIDALFCSFDGLQLDIYGTTILMLAATYRNIYVLNKLTKNLNLNQLIDEINKKNNSGMNFMFALLIGDGDMDEKILKFITYIFNRLSNDQLYQMLIIKDIENKTFLMGVAYAYGYNDKIVDLIFERLNDDQKIFITNQVDSNNKCAVMHTLRHSYEPIVNMLLKYTTTENKIYYAIKSKHILSVEDIIKTDPMKLCNYILDNQNIKLNPEIYINLLQYFRNRMSERQTIEDIYKKTKSGPLANLISFL